MRPLAILLFFLAAPAMATVYQCRDAGGNLFLTDDPANFPQGCQPEGILVETTGPAASGPASSGADREASKGEATEQAGPFAPAPAAETPRSDRDRGGPPPALKEEALELAREYRETAAENGPEGPGPSREERLRQLESLVGEFRRRLDSSSLTPEQREEIEAVLPPGR